MTTDSHSRGSKRDQSRRKVKKYVKVDGMDEEYERKKAEIRMQFNFLMNLFERIKED